jgi:hypothetical protein
MGGAMKMSRKAKRYDETILPGNFQDFESFQDGDPARDGRVLGAVRRKGRQVELEHLCLEHHPARKQSFAKLRSRAERLTQQVTYLREQLEIVDHDRRGMYIQIRSLPPYKDDTQIQFNEISIARDKVILKRIAFYRKDEVKQQVPLDLTEDELQRLLADIRQVFATA